MDVHRRLIASNTDASVNAGFPWGVHPSGKSFVNAKGECITYLGVSAFPLLDRWLRGEDLGWVRDHFPLANILRVWPYVDWNIGGWDAPPPYLAVAFAEEMYERWGWGVEFTILTSNNPRRVDWARNYCMVLGNARLPNVLLEGANEPVRNNIDTDPILLALQESGYMWSSGRYEDEDQQRDRLVGVYGTAHTPRERDFARRGHDLREYFDGSGPTTTHTPMKTPWVGDEPIRPDQVQPQPVGTIPQNYRAHGAVCALLGAGVTFHYEGGKTGTPPTLFEQECADELFKGATAFEPSERLGNYERIVEPGQMSEARTYVVNNSMVRIWQTGGALGGFVAIDNEAILCKRV